MDVKNVVMNVIRKENVKLVGILQKLLKIGNKTTN